MFDSNILRDWNDELAQEVVSDVWKYIPKKRVTTIKGQTEKMHCGMECTVIEDKGYQNITVQFEDGTIIENTSREKFREKSIKNPNIISISNVMDKFTNTNSKGSFALLYPDLLVDWDYNTNTLDPKEIIPGTNIEVQWKCHKCGYLWTAKINKRCMGRSICKECHYRAIERDARIRTIKNKNINEIS